VLIWSVVALNPQITTFAESITAVSVAFNTFSLGFRLLRLNWDMELALKITASLFFVTSVISVSKERSTETSVARESETVKKEFQSRMGNQYAECGKWKYLPVVFCKNANRSCSTDAAPQRTGPALCKGRGGYSISEVFSALGVSAYLVSVGVPAGVMLSLSRTICASAKAFRTLFRETSPSPITSYHGASLSHPALYPPSEVSSFRFNEFAMRNNGLSSWHPCTKEAPKSI
jgi:hypothetical protein